MTSGIYCYKDTWNHDQIVYIGKDKHIWKNKRHKNHISPSRYKNQKINQILQNNPQRYRYEILIRGNYSNTFLNAFERIAIWYHTPKFNFTKGGDGVSVPRNLNKQTKSFVRIIKAGKKNGKQVWKIHYDNKVMGRSQDKEFLETLIPKYFDQDGFLLYDFSETKKQISELLKKHGNKQMAITQSENHNSSGYRNVSIRGDRYIYRYHKNGVRKHIQAYSVHELKQKVQKEGLLWEEFNE